MTCILVVICALLSISGSESSEYGYQYLTADTVFSEQIEIPSYIREMIEYGHILDNENVLIAKRNLVLHDFRDELPDGYPEQLLGNIALELDTCIVFACVNQNSIQPISEIDAAIDGYADGVFRNSYSLRRVSNSKTSSENSIPHDIDQ